jgi:thiamine phosphate phosphatase / amino-HMP aminohydrolase
MFTSQNSMSLASQAPTAFILDFDGTITVKDTISVLGNIGVEWQGKRGVDVKGRWDEVVKEYGRDFEDHVREYELVKEDRRTLDEEIRYYRGLREIEERSFGRVSQSGLFRGMTKEDWESAGREATQKGDVVVRKAFKDFLETLKQDGIMWGIVSVNFSGFFIRGVVAASASLESEDVEVLANESDENGVLVGPRSESGRVLATSDVKLASMKDLLKSWSDRTSSETSRTVYIGDSGTDIECLMEQGVIGIVISDDEQSSLMQTMNRIGVNILHIEAYEETGSRGKRIYWARDFDEILQSPVFPQR